MSIPVFDLHCDLLAYLNKDPEENSPMDDVSRCSLPLLQKGGVVFQTLALFSETGKGSRKEFEGQLECFQRCEEFVGKRAQFALAIENASGLLEEEEPLDLLYKRFDAHPWLYLSLTWKEENRFGGGDTSEVGLKEDGKVLLEHMDGKRVAIDLSHTSDPLAEEILNTIDQKGLSILPIASHSNYRAVKDHPRNLPDHLAREIIRRGGVIGINFVQKFVGDQPEDFIRHIEHALSLGGEDAIVLGSDFFGGLSLPALEELDPLYQEPFSNSGCFPSFYKLLDSFFGKELIEKIFYKNSQILLNPGALRESL
ncbi:MAG: membrane dipeptidase [Chlamydiia bacterium]|nr:membrane dipeptidase [Chlamydiia bacterium]